MELLPSLMSVPTFEHRKRLERWIAVVHICVGARYIFSVHAVHTVVAVRYHTEHIIDTYLRIMAQFFCII
jgi:hypothetical protein